MNIRKVEDTEGIRSHISKNDTIYWNDITPQTVP